VDQNVVVLVLKRLTKLAVDRFRASNLAVKAISGAIVSQARDLVGVETVVEQIAAHQLSWSGVDASVRAGINLDANTFLAVVATGTSGVFYAAIDGGTVVHVDQATTTSEQRKRQN
jgi:hypothetical protein